MPTRIVVMVGALAFGAGCALYGQELHPAKNAPSLAPSPRAEHVPKEPAGAEYLGRVRLFGNGFADAEGCRRHLLEDARELGGDLVVGARPFDCPLSEIDIYNKPCCEGDVYRSPRGAKAAPPQ